MTIDLVGIDARQRRGEFARCAFRDDEFGGRDVDPGEPDAVAARRGAGARDREQIIVGAGVEQRVFGQRARRDQPHHVAAHHALVAARPRRRRILGLFAHRDPMAGRDQPVQIILGALHRHAAHRDVQALMLAALGQHDAERLRGDLGVLEEQLVEIAHPVEQQQPGMGGLDLEVLLHHRRDARRRLGGGAASGGTGMDCWIVMARGNYKILPPVLSVCPGNPGFPRPRWAGARHLGAWRMTDRTRMRRRSESVN